MEIKEKIISGARQMFIKHGIRSVTMDMIASQLGISKRTIYENFKDKDTLVTECLSSAIKEHRIAIEDILNNSPNIIEATLKFIKSSVAVMKTINPLFFFDIQKYYPDLWEQKIAENDNRSIRNTIELLKKGIQQGLFRNEINIEIVAKLISEQFKMLSDVEIFPEDKFSRIEVFENIVINFMRGIATDNGLKLIKEYYT